MFGQDSRRGPTFSFPCSDLTLTLEMFWKELQLQEQEMLKAVDSAVPTSLDSPTYHSSSSLVSVLDNISHQVLFEQGQPCEENI